MKILLGVLMALFIFSSGVLLGIKMTKRFEKIEEEDNETNNGISTQTKLQEGKMKSVLISIQPKFCELIANGKKTIEVRKTRPKIETPFKCYIYCTKPKYDHEDFITVNAGTEKAVAFYGGGKVIGEFICDTIYPIEVFRNGTIRNWNYYNLSKSCLSFDEMAEYIGRPKTVDGCHTGYGWHISDLVIYDEPKKLTAFMKPCNKGDFPCGLCEHFGYKLTRQIDYVKDKAVVVGTKTRACTNWVKKAPQSWCYVEEL